MADRQQHWLNNLSTNQQNTLLAGLRRMDVAERLDYTSPFVRSVQCGIETIMEGMVRHVSNQRITVIRENVKLEGRINLVRCGSFYNEMKMGQPCEFDFAIEISDKIVDARNVESINSTYKSIIPLLSQGIEATALPQGWRHGGYNSPVFGGFRRNGPAQMLQFVYTDPERVEDDLPITVDLLLVVRLGNRDTVPFKEDSHYDYLAYANYWQYAWRIIPAAELTDYTHSPSEAAWLGDCGPHVKTIIRILKCLNAQSTPDRGDLSEQYLALHSDELAVDRMTDADHVHILRNMKLKWLQLADIQQGNNYLLRHHEVYPPIQYFPSYLFQSMVLMVHNICFRVNRDVIWTERDIPRVIVTVLESILTYLDAWRRLPTDQAIQGPVVADYPEWEIGLNGQRYSSRRIKRLMKKEQYEIRSSIAHVTSMLHSIQQIAGVNPPHDQVIPGLHQAGGVYYECVLLGDIR